MGNAMTLLRQIASTRQSVWWLLAILAIYSSGAWSAAGYVHEATGEVFAQRGSGTAQSVKTGDIFDSGTTFRTTGNGKVVIKFEDGQLASLQPNTTFRVDQYNYNTSNPGASNSAVSLVEGALRFVTGVIGSTNRNAVSFRAGTTATIGIRGTDLTVLVDATTQAVLTAIAAGAIVLETPLGVTNVGVGQFSSSLPGKAPTGAAPTASAPAVTQAIVTALQAAPIPVNTPVVIASAAAAAVAVVQAREAQAVAAASPANAELQIAAKTAAAQAETAIQTAVTQAQTALQTAIQNGATVPAAPAVTPITPAPVPLLQRVEDIIKATPTPPPVDCAKASPC